MNTGTGAWILCDDGVLKVATDRTMSAHANPMTILLADDCEASRLIQKSHLQELGYQADAVANGEEVLRALSVQHYDVVMLDISMPVMDGLETARRIRDPARHRQPFLVAVSAGTVHADHERIRQAGFDAYIAKPARLREIAGVLEQAPIARHSEATVASATEDAASETVVLDPGTWYGRLGPAADQLFRRVIPVYLRELPGREQGLRDALRDRDAASLARVCHSLKGTSRVLGATELAERCEVLETDAYAGNLPDREAVEQLLDLARRTARKLRAKLDALVA